MRAGCCAVVEPNLSGALDKSVLTLSENECSLAGEQERVKPDSKKFSRPVNLIGLGMPTQPLAEVSGFLAANLSPIAQRYRRLRLCPFDN